MQTFNSLPGKNLRNKLNTYDSQSQRKWTRIKTNGIVALSCFDKPVIALIHDIAEGGISFVHAGNMDMIDEEFPMDILIFDILMDFEYHLSFVRGRVKERQQVVDSKHNAPVWRYHVEFLELHPKESQLLQMFCDPAGIFPTSVM